MGSPKALVLSGGGNRGALQVGALQALQERGFSPDLIVGVSAGALNAAYLAAYGWGQEQLHALVRFWMGTRKEHIYPGNLPAMALRTLRGEASLFPNDRFAQFLREALPTDARRFGDLGDPRLYIVASRLDTGEAYVFGDDPKQSVIDALMASTALPPLHPPWRVDGDWLADGGIASNLPASIAIRRGGRELAAVLVADHRDQAVIPHDLFGNASRAMIAATRQRYQAEIDLIRKRGRLITISGYEGLLPWDFSHTAEMIADGYCQTMAQLDEERVGPQAMWRRIACAVRRRGAAVGHLAIADRDSRQPSLRGAP